MSIPPKGEGPTDRFPLRAEGEKRNPLFGVTCQVCGWEWYEYESVVLQCSKCGDDEDFRKRYQEGL